jgi:FixJ family two-component response regulator
VIPSLEQQEDPQISTHCPSALSRDVETTIMPILNRLKKSSADPVQTSRLLNRLETEVQLLVQTYGHNTRPVIVYQRLSTIEALIALMVKQGLASPMIAEALNISPGTVRMHRKHIRKKISKCRVGNVFLPTI